MLRTDNKNYFLSKILLSLVLFTSSTVMAETAYVSDELEIMVRSGKSSTHRIIATLKSGSKINVIERDTESGYSKVAISPSREGWVLSRLLNKSPSAKSRLARAEASATKLQAETTSAKQQLAELIAQKGSLDSETGELKQLNTSLSRELEQLRETSSNAVQILQERDHLQQRVVNIERELESLKRENDMLKNSDSQDWFLIGASVLLFGIFLGFILPKLTWRRKSSWQSPF
ncbi:MAG: TIGR04211 family SH3 domain-containing protein [Cycloclasticus sp.]|nr:TIGR04211 family SH3 domain-containing protein [Cycloclasticus sp.]